MLSQGQGKVNDRAADSSRCRAVEECTLARNRQNASAEEKKKKKKTKRTDERTEKEGLFTYHGHIHVLVVTTSYHAC